MEGSSRRNERQLPATASSWKCAHDHAAKIEAETEAQRQNETKRTAGSIFSSRRSGSTTFSPRSNSGTTSASQPPTSSNSIRPSGMNPLRSRRERYPPLRQAPGTKEADQSSWIASKTFIHW